MSKQSSHKLIGLVQDSLRNDPEFKIQYPTLLAVSAGIDSVVMAHVFHEMDLPFGIAHVNYQLRGMDSDEDAMFVAELAQKLGVLFHSTSYDTRGILSAEMQNLQLLARDMRYAWFLQIAKQHDYKQIATAHHLDDSLETVLLNLSKGAGIRGLSGIPYRRGRIMRPMIQCTRADILAYAKANGIVHRDDSSNAKTLYSRNKIRHLVLPSLRDINPALSETYRDTRKNLQETEALYAFAVEQILAKLLQYTERDELLIPIDDLLKTPAPRSIVYEALLPYQFLASQTDDVMALLDAPSGKRVLSPSHICLKDRGRLIVAKREQQLQELIYIEQPDGLYDFVLGTLMLENQLKQPDEIIRSAHVAQLDLDKLEFPLILRPWQEGDVFCPLGMQGKQKKISDLLIDRKRSILEKQNTWVLISAEQICWVLGEQIDDRFKISPLTTRHVKFELTY
jgi:tRNA(Ile)-lysidine synthase